MTRIQPNILYFFTFLLFILCKVKFYSSVMMILFYVEVSLSKSEHAIFN